MIFNSQRLLGLLLGTWLLAGVNSAPAQEPSGLQAAVALESVLVDTIAKAEKSVVAVARLRKQSPDASPAAELGEGLSGEGADLFSDPTRPDYVPHDFGSGVVIDSRGLILTTYHVVGDIRVSRYLVWIGKKPYPATVKAADPWLDLAVLKIEANELQALALGDAKSLKKGQIVLALGNPYAIARDGEPSATWGIIANLARPAPPAPERTGAGATEGRFTLHHYGNLIQTDARLELGSSGGALVNLKGELIGITTSLAALVGYEKSGGFAIPVDEDFRRSLETLKSGRVPEYGFLGVAPTFLAAEERRQGRFGARLLDVVPSTPAAKSGLQPGDVITHVEGEPISDELQLIRRLSGLPADTNVQLTLERGGGANRRGKVVTSKVTLSKKRVEGPRPAFAEQPDPSWRGLRVEYATATPQFRDHSRDLDPEGSLGVIDVEKDSAAWKAGLRPGEFISHVGKSRVTTPKQFYQATADLRGSVSLKLSGLLTGTETRTIAAE
ncbi:Periplasmic serine endoprotease DegP precursor [Anatilimnocola aggregata]|uniref:Periplasmic serine endoprotease DegP n=1 Tax=Anatilimnocola aggregata TaxID=2528021 RepID=A0A517YCB1_9BACT|nr:trypsin-like peptidase domain-containing protein [Anatilimnocola aggregata]QDU27864.1 Periplasmic serine endoprotease DegP precursor [Anatilimnocola aggregata]